MLAVVVWLLASAAGGSADGDPVVDRVWLAPFQPLSDSVPRGATDRVTRAIHRGLLHSGLEVVQPPTSSPEAAAALTDGRVTWNAGQAALRAGDFDTAVAAFDRATAALERTDDPADILLIPDAYLAAAEALFRDGQEAAADVRLRRVVHFAPERRLDAGRYPPVFARAFSAAREAVLDLARTRVEIIAAKGDRIAFDGRPVGTSKVTLVDVLPGRHLVSATRADGASAVARVHAKTGRTVTVRLAATLDDAVADALAAVRSNGIEARHIERLVDRANRDGATRIVVGGLHPGTNGYAINTLLIDPTTAWVVRLAVAEVDLELLSIELDVEPIVAGIVDGAGSVRPVDGPPYPVAAPHALGLGLITTQRVARASAAPDAPAVQLAKETPSVAADAESSELWWLWVTLGVVAAAAVGAGVYMATSDSSPEAGAVSVRW